jgi:hypothetical protein
VLVLLGGGAIASGVALAVSRASTLDRARQRAEGAGTFLTAGVEGLRQDLRKRADEAGSIPELRAAVENQVDTVTFLDLFDKEDWWSGYRDYASAIVRDGKVAVARGMTPALAWEAARSPGAVRVADREGSDPILLATHVHPLKSGGGFTLVMGRPLDVSALSALRGGPVAAVGVTDGQRMRVGAGEGAAALIPALAGRTAERLFVGPSGAWAAAAVALDENLSVVGVTAALPPAPAGALVWGLVATGALLSIAGFVVAGRRRAGAAEPAARTESPPEAGATASAMPVGVSRVLPLVPQMGQSPGQSPGPSMGLSPPRSSGPIVATALSAEMNPAFGRYVLLDRIGEGGMSEVFRAKLTGAESFTKLVAIKRLKPHLALMPDAVNQFIDEARMGSVLAHSNIASVSDFGRVGDGYYLAEEYIAGRTLAEISARHTELYGGPVPLAFVLYIASEVLSALAYAHERADDDGRPLGIVHRDISPTNIMVSFQGEVKLLDFGIGKSVDRVSQTREGAIKGNVGYMAPEQARGQEVTALADLFSLGLVIFDLLAGEPFYQGRGAGEVLFQAATGPTTEHMARIARLPPPVPDLLRTVLSIDPAGRFPSARAFALAFGAPMTVAKTQVSVLMSSLFRNKT